MVSTLEMSNQKRLPMEVSGCSVLPRRVKTVDILVAEGIQKVLPDCPYILQ